MVSLTAFIRRSVFRAMHAKLLVWRYHLRLFTTAFAMETRRRDNRCPRVGCQYRIRWPFSCRPFKHTAPNKDCDCGSQSSPQDLIGFLSLYKKCVMQAAVQTSNPGLVALNQWCKRVGLAPITAWRFRKRGWLRTVNIAGRIYITDQAIREFTQRAEAGEFAREHKVPTPPSRERYF